MDDMKRAIVKKIEFKSKRLILGCNYTPAVLQFIMSDSK